MLDRVSSLATIMYRIAKILFLFTKSDLVTVLLPVTIFALLSTPADADARRVATAVLWTWLHLLQFCISNQLKNQAEDAANKPWRPIPARLIGVAAARPLRWLLLPLCLALSARVGVLWPCVSLCAAVATHNELGLDAHWLARHLCNSWGYASFNAGAANIAHPSSNTALRQHVLASILCNALIIFTTIHAQDFRDNAGDALCGRRTLPLAFPEASRVSVALAVAGWAVALSAACGLRPASAAVFVAFSAAIGLRFYLRRSVEDDRFSYLYYNVWLATAQIIHLPRVSRVLSY